MQLIGLPVYLGAEPRQSNETNPDSNDNNSLNASADNPRQGTNDRGTTRRRWRRLRSLLSCLIPRRTSRNSSNRWEGTVTLRSTCKIENSLIVKVIGNEGFATDDTSINLPMLPCDSKHAPRKLYLALEDDDKIRSNDDFRKNPPLRRCSFVTDVSEQSDEKTDDGKYSTNDDHGRKIDCTETCSICWDSFKRGEKVCWSLNTNCRHGFHLDCMAAWLEKHKECPLCRSDYIFDCKNSV